MSFYSAVNVIVRSSNAITCGAISDSRDDPISAIDSSKRQLVSLSRFRINPPTAAVAAPASANRVST